MNTLNLIKGNAILQSHIDHASKIIKNRGESKKVVIIKFNYLGTMDEKASKAIEVSTNHKIHAFSKAGLQGEIHKINYNIPSSDFDSLLESFNSDKNVIGIIAQQRIPISLVSHVSNLAPYKDIDGITKKGTYHSSAVAESALRVLLSKIDNSSKIALVGAKGYVGRDIAYLLRENNVNFIGIDVGDDLNLLCEANIIISAMGKPGVIQKYLKDNDVVIDTGFSVEGDSLDIYLGDVPHNEYSRLKFVTPVPGGMGPLSIATLLERVLHLGYGINLPKWTV